MIVYFLLWAHVLHQLGKLLEITQIDAALRHTCDRCVDGQYLVPVTGQQQASRFAHLSFHSFDFRSLAREQRNPCNPTMVASEPTTDHSELQDVPGLSLRSARV